MKNKAIALLMAISMSFAPVTINAEAGWDTEFGYCNNVQYAETACIYSITPEGDDFLLTVFTGNKNIFQFTFEDGDWEKGDLISFDMYTMGTNGVRDDEVDTSSVRYSYHLSEYEQRLWFGE